MVDSTFNVDTFQNTEIEGANSTEFTPVPEGEFVASVSKFAIRQAKQSVILDLTWGIDDAGVAAETGIDNPSVRQSIFLDVSDSGGLEGGKGKNVQLGRLREALNQNQNGQPWSFGQLIGQVAKVSIKHRMYEDATYAEVKGVVAVS